MIVFATILASCTIVHAQESPVSQCRIVQSGLVLEPSDILALKEGQVATVSYQEWDDLTTVWEAATVVTFEDGSYFQPYRLEHASTLGAVIVKYEDCSTGEIAALVQQAADYYYYLHGKTRIFQPWNPRLLEPIGRLDYRLDNVCKTYGTLPVNPSRQLFLMPTGVNFRRIIWHRNSEAYTTGLWVGGGYFVPGGTVSEVTGEDYYCPHISGMVALFANDLDSHFVQSEGIWTIGLVFLPRIMNEN